MSAFRKLIRNKDGSVALDAGGQAQREETWMFKFSYTAEGRRRQQTGFNYATKGDAEEAERAARRAIKSGHVAEVKAILNPKTVRRASTLDAYFKLYREMPPSSRRANEDTRECNIRRLRDVLVTVGHVEPEKAPVTVLTGRLVYEYKLAVERRGATETEERRKQLQRSANATLRQAVSVFGAEYCEYYTHIGGLEIPDSIAAFRSAPQFKGCKKEEYTPPADTVIAATFEALAKLEASDLNLFKVCWLALGFGLRKSEIEQARNSWFVEIEGAPYLAGDELAKNHHFPRVRAQLGAWAKLQPHVQGKEAKAFVLTGPDTERTDQVFRRCSAWMRSLGWQTQHHVHELRAFAGCQVAMHSAKHLYDAQTFMRHASVTTTESAYGHHLKRHLDEVTLTVPAKAEFKPILVQGGAQ